MSDTSGNFADVFTPRIPLLQDKHDFYSWKGRVTVYLKRHSLWDVVSGVTPRPVSPAASTAAPTAEQESWDSASRDGIAFLYHSVDATVRATFPLYDTAPSMWKALMGRYHHRDARSLLRSFTAVSTLRYSESSEESLPEYLDSFIKHWGDLASRTFDAEPPTRGRQNSLETALRVLATSEEAKMEFLMRSLSPSLCLMAIDLKQRDGQDLSFDDLWSFLLRVHAFREREASRELEEAQRKDCTWCRSRGFDSAGHGSSGCERLQEFKKEGSGGRRERKQRRRRQRV